MTRLLRLTVLCASVLLVPLVACAAPHWEFDLNWPQGAPANADGYRIERKLGATGAWGLLGGDLPAAPMAATDLGPYQDGQIVCWRIVAFNASGVTTGPEGCFPAPTQFPGQPGPPTGTWRWSPN
jgi:hypothetical protein